MGGTCGGGGSGYHLGDAAVSNADPDLGLLRPALSVGHTDDVCAVGGLDVARRAGDRHVDFIHTGAGIRVRGRNTLEGDVSEFGSEHDSGQFWKSVLLHAVRP